MAANCNIAGIILEKVKQGNWGFAADLSLDKQIGHNYVENLACIGLYLKECGEPDTDTCEAETVIEVSCNINLVGISFQTGSVNGFFLSTGDIYGAKQPIQYQWTIDLDDFDVIGPLNQPVVNIKPKAGKLIENIVSPVTLSVTDANGCTDSKQCYYTPTGMKCSNSFVPCSTIDNLQVGFRYVICSAPKNLTITLDTTQR